MALRNKHNPGKRPLKTLDRVLSKAGIGSRTETREWIAAGRIEVNGKQAQSAEQWIDLDRDVVSLDGKPIEGAPKKYVLLYKPKGYLTTYKDPDGRPTVYDLIQGLPEYMVPVGRLDLDTSGLLILTNDTQFAERVMNPDHKVSKTYLVKASGRLSEEQMERLRQGVELEDGVTRPAEVRQVRQDEGKTVLELVLTEGRNRQVRRMIEAVGSRVRKLVRTAIGPVTIGKLEIGKYRPLEREEVNALAGVEWIKPATERRRKPPARDARVRGGEDTRGGRESRTRRSGDGTAPAPAAKRAPRSGGRFEERPRPPVRSPRSGARDAPASGGPRPDGRGKARSGPAKSTRRPSRPPGRGK